MKNLNMNKCVLFLRTLLVFAACNVIFACAAPQVTQTVSMPAKEASMTKVKKLAVVNFKGDKQRAFSTQLEALLASIQVQGAQYFTIVERDMLQKVLDELRLNAESGLVKDDDAVRLGELSGADTIVSGAVRGPKHEDIRSEQVRRRCNRYVEKDGHKQCAEYISVKVFCTKQLAHIDFTFKAISVEGGEITFVKNYTGEASNLYCSDKGQKQSRVHLAEAATRKAMDILRRDVAPYDVQVSLSLMKKDRSDINSQAKAHLKSGIEFAKSERMDRACEHFRLGVAAFAQSPALYHNLGVCSEIQSDYDKAMRMFKRADALLSKPDKMISSALKRIQVSKNNNDKLSQQLRE